MIRSVAAEERREKLVRIEPARPFGREARGDADTRVSTGIARTGVAVKNGAALDPFVIGVRLADALDRLLLARDEVGEASVRRRVLSYTRHRHR